MKIYTYKYPKPSVTTDCIISRQKNEKMEVLLINREYEPFIDKWALPGGFVEIEEDLLDGAVRELNEETGLKNIRLKQFKTYGKPGRDPRGRTISVVYVGQMPDNNTKVQANDDASMADWFAIDDLPPLAFDHDHIIREYLDHLIK